jgi:soluble epoxide hydrolase/lipid-phosphate phosphatase
MEHIVKMLPRLAYQIYFEKHTHSAIKELNKDIRRTLRATLRDVESEPPKDFLTSIKDFLKAWGHLEELPRIPFMTEEEEDYMVEQYSIQGFDKTIQFYMHGNRLHAHESAAAQKNFTIPQPALFLYPNMDPVADWKLTAKIVKSEHFIPHLKSIEIDQSAHWPQLEQPEAFNRELSKWLKETEEKDEPKQKRDEL